MSIIAKLRRIFDRKMKIKLVWLFAGILGGALLETVALSLISPFLSVLLDPEVINSNRIFQLVYSLFGFSSTSGFLCLLSVSLAFLYIFRGVYMYLLNVVQHRFIGNSKMRLSNQLLDKMLDRPYPFHAKHNIAQMQRIIITDADQMFAVINGVLSLMTDGFLSLFILLFLLVVSPAMTITVILLSGFCVLVYFKVFRKSIRRAGADNREKGIEMLKAVNQAFGGIKEVKVLRKEAFFSDVFRVCGKAYIRANQKYQSLTVVPKLFIEAVCFGGTFIFVAVYIACGYDLMEIVPQLGLFVVAAFRLLPAVSRAVNYITSIMFNCPGVHAAYDSLFSVDPPPPPFPEGISIPYSNNIVVKDVAFSYEDGDGAIFEHASLIIPENKSVAFVGASGAGKTTMADLILGILCPQGGYVAYQGKSIHHEFPDWGRHIGYIPQQIYMLDETIRENVAFGVPRQEIDDGRIWKALEQAQISDFVRGLPEGLDTVVGDRGVRLSGGQRQRVGIARAMYDNPPIMVFDEATSSLDTETEAAVMEAIHGLQGSKTLIIIAHRLTTIEKCDMVYRIEEKRVERER